MLKLGEKPRYGSLFDNYGFVIFFFLFFSMTATFIASKSIVLVYQGTIVQRGDNTIYG